MSLADILDREFKSLDEGILIHSFKARNLDPPVGEQLLLVKNQAVVLDIDKNYLSRLRNQRQPLTADKARQFASILRKRQPQEAIDSLIKELLTTSESRSGDGVRLLKSEDYFDLLRGVIKGESEDGDSASNSAEAWFFHPVESLPVLRKKKIQEIWVNNLDHGVDMHLVWPLPVSGEAVIYAYSSQVAEILSEVDENAEKKGNIHFWALSLNDGIPSEAADVFKNLKGTERLEIHAPIDLAEQPKLLKVLMYDSLILNLGPSRSCAAMYLNGVTDELGGSTSSGWLFAPTMVGTLHTLASALKKTINT